LTRKTVQDQDRLPVLQYFREKGMLVEINGEGSIEAVQTKIREALND
jgi:adenylate kinase family enzyme